MGSLTNKDRRTVLDDAEDLGDFPSGGRIKKWLVGMLLPMIPVIYGILCLKDKKPVVLFGKQGSMDLGGKPGIALAASYVALGLFVHFHYYWGLDSNLWRFSPLGKLVALLVFVPCFLYAICSTFTIFS